MTRTDPVRITITVEAHPSTETVEIDRAKWDAMTTEQRCELLDDMTQVAISNAGGAGWNIEDPDDMAGV